VHQQAAAGDRHGYGARTRFIPPQVAALFEARAWPEAAADTPSSPARASVIDIAARMREKWRSPR
jgi:DNA helicase-2/ATP-dependent DNA helicase PcrA